MEEHQRISKLFADLYNGSPWIDVNLYDAVKSLDLSTVSKRYEDLNTIWEILNHLIEWRKTVLQRIQGIEIITPSHNYFTPVSDTSEKAWEKTLLDIQDSQDKWLQFLSDNQPLNLDGKNGTNGMSYYEHIHGILQHDSYHLGQIIIFTKMSKVKQ